MSAGPAAEHVAASSGPAPWKAGPLWPATELRWTKALPAAEALHATKTLHAAEALPAAAELRRAKSGHPPRTARRSAEFEAALVITVVIVIVRTAHWRSGRARAAAAGLWPGIAWTTSLGRAAIGSAVARSASLVIAISVAIAIVAASFVSRWRTPIIRLEGGSDRLEVRGSSGIGLAGSRGGIVGPRGPAGQADCGCEQPGSRFEWGVFHSGPASLLIVRRRVWGVENRDRVSLEVQWIDLACQLRDAFVDNFGAGVVAGLDCVAEALNLFLHPLELQLAALLPRLEVLPDNISQLGL
jgi:hypothetical protein